MNILLLGSDSCAHAIAFAIASSSTLKELGSKLWIASNNPGTAQCGINLPNINVNDFVSIERFVRQNNVDKIIVATEEPLIKGIYDYFKKLGLRVTIFGPSKKGVMFGVFNTAGKHFMRKYGIPHALFRVFSHVKLPQRYGAVFGTLQQGFEHIDESKAKSFVIKANGHAPSKGVKMVYGKEKAKKAFDKMMKMESMGTANTTILVEEFLRGARFSVPIVTDGRSYKILSLVRDYKYASQDASRLNSTRAGAVSFDGLIDSKLMQKFKEKIAKKTIAGLKASRIAYKGFIYVDCVDVKGEPYVIGYNTCINDPGIQAVLPRIKDFGGLLLAIQNRTLSRYKLEIDPQACAALMLSTKGSPNKGKLIKLPPRYTQNSMVYKGNVLFQENLGLITDGPQALTVVSLGPTPHDAIEESKSTARKIRFPGKSFSTKIGRDL